MDDKSCRWCKWLVKGNCTNTAAFEKAEPFEFYPFYESGTLHEAIQEGFSDVEINFSSIECLLILSRVSKANQQKILESFQDAFEKLKVKWVEGIDERVIKALSNFNFEVAEGVEITNPCDFCCKHYW